MAGLRERDLLFVRYEKASRVDRACLPYYIALDHETKSVGAAPCAAHRRPGSTPASPPCSRLCRRAQWSTADLPVCLAAAVGPSRG